MDAEVEEEEVAGDGHGDALVGPIATPSPTGVEGEAPRTPPRQTTATSPAA